jgi:hypothetical protein
MREDPAIVIRHISRRRFIGWLAVVAPLPIFVRGAHAAAVDVLTNPRADAPEAETLRALGATVLPSELGMAGQERVVTAFQQWMTAYRERAELNHAYGNSRIRYSPPTPAIRWAEQLRDLEEAAHQQFGRAFADSSAAQRRELVRAALAPLRADAMPSVGTAPHVAIALLAHFYESADAIDLCYAARIGKSTCRPLAEQVHRPLPLAPGRGTD